MFSNELLEFLNTEITFSKSRLFKDKGLEIYIRNSPYILPNETVRVICIALISIEPEYRFKGLGSSVIEVIHSFNPTKYTLIELVGNPVLASLLERRLWLKYSVDDLFLTYNYYKATGK